MSAGIQTKLDNYPIEFTKLVEHMKTKEFRPSVEYILNQLGIAQEFNNLPSDFKHGFEELMSQLFSFGFYSGFNFAMDPEGFANRFKEED